MPHVKKKSRRWDPWKQAVLKVAGEDEIVFHNNRYHVYYRECPNKNRDGPNLIHLSIKNNDRSPIRDWRDLQRIKNEIVGPEYEMVELFPRESQLVDLANQYHLWGYKTTEPIFTNNGIGWQQGRKVWDGIGPNPDPNSPNAVQRPFDQQ